MGAGVNGDAPPMDGRTDLLKDNLDHPEDRP